MDISLDKVIALLTSLVCDKGIIYATVNTNGYWNNGNNVFPDRICVGWMIYIPSIILPELIPEAAKIVPVSDGEKQGEQLLFQQKKYLMEIIKNISENLMTLK